MFGGLTFGGGTFGGFIVPAAGPLIAAATLSFSTTTSLTLQLPLTAAATISFSVSASLAGYTATAGITFSTSANLTVSKGSAVGITIDGVNVRPRVRMKGLTIHDILNDAPNTCSLVMEGDGPAVGQSLRITIANGTLLLFSGQIQTVEQTFDLQPEQVAWKVNAIDDTALANYKRPFGAFQAVSATTIAQTLTAQFTPGFSTAGIEAGLDPVTIVFDGTDTFIAALTRLATAIGGYTKIEDRTVYLFTDESGTPPDPIDASHCFMHSPQIRAHVDSSQLRTRVYGKGYGEAVPTDLLAGETLIPLDNGAQFPDAGRAILGITADGAQSERVSYTGKVASAGGTLVGPGAAPTTPLGVSLAAGTGVEAGLHEYAAVFVTADGRSLPGPRAPITVGTVTPPVGTVTANAAVSGPGPDAGSHRYYVVFRTASGATLPGPASNSVTTTSAVTPPVPPGSGPGASSVIGSGLTLGAFYYYKMTFRRVSDNAETQATDVIGPDGGGSVFLWENNADWKAIGVKVVTPPAGYVQVMYRTGANETNTPANFREIQTPTLEGPQLDGFMYWVDHSESRKSTPLPTGNATAIASVPLSAIPTYPSALVTQVELYREFNAAGAATARLALTVANGTTTATDTTPNSGLGALVPATNTATANRVQVTWAAGPTAATSIDIYRTPVGSSQLKLVQSVPGHAAGSLIDSTPDASLGANAPTDDTSGLEQPDGQVVPGSPTLIVASASPFRASGGWVSLAGGQVVRYSGTSGQTLTGIPETGPGAITTAVIYGAPAIPLPMLTGVTGLARPIQKGAAIHIWVQRDDLQAQAEQAARAGGDGVIEYVLVDQRRGLPSLTARCDAELQMFARPLVTVAYATRDTKTKSGKRVTVNLDAPAIHETLTIQDVTITEIDIAPGLAPRYTVSASSVRFSLEDTLRRLIAGGLITGGSS